MNVILQFYTMLQFNTTVCTITGRFTPRLCWRFTALFATSSTQPLANQSVNIAKKILGPRPTAMVMNQKQHAKFNELKLKVSESLSPGSSVIPKIQSAGNVHELLSLIKMPYLTQGDILKVMSTIVSWVQNNNGNMLPENKPPVKNNKPNKSTQATAKQATATKVEPVKSDIQFDKTDCSKLDGPKKEATATKAEPVQSDVQFDKTDCSEFDGPKEKAIATKAEPVTGDVQFDKTDFSEFADLSTSMMIKEISTLRVNNHRNVRLLRYLYDNILEHNHMLTLGECSSLLFNMCTLNYPCKILLDKISLDIMKTVTDLKQRSVHSIIKSMAILKYRNESFLNYMGTIINNSDTSIEQTHIANILHSFAILGYTSDITNMIIEKYVPLLTPNTLGADKWLDVVWSLALLKYSKPSVITTVLNNDFITDLMSRDLQRNISRQLKLLNINGFAKYIALSYSGPFLDHTKVHPIVSPYSKEKQMYIDMLQGTLKTIVLDNCFKIGVNTNMGFVVDAECYLNGNLEPIDTNNKSEHTNLKKMVIMLYDYHSYCLDSTECLGLVNFYKRLLKASGYRVCHVSYKHFGLEDKPLKRIDVLKRRMLLAQ